MKSHGFSSTQVSRYGCGQQIFFLCKITSFIFFAYSAGIYDVLDAQLETLGLSSECIGGGKIEHNPAEKTVIVFGASQVRFYSMYLCCASYDILIIES